MKAICETMGVARSRQYERRQEGVSARGRRYRRADDDRYLALIRQIIDVRTTCGYRRVTVFLNRLLTRQGEPVVNPKRVYRLMEIGGLLLQRSTGRPQRVHDGTIMTTRSNRRWCSDAFDIACNGVGRGSGWSSAWTVVTGRSSATWAPRAASMGTWSGI